MHVLAVLMHTLSILHFSRPQPSFKLIFFALAHLPYIVIFYFSNCLFHTENKNVVWPLPMKELLRRPCATQLQHLCGSLKLKMLLSILEAVLVFWVISSLSPQTFLAPWSSLASAVKALSVDWGSHQCLRNHCHLTSHILWLFLQFSAPNLLSEPSLVFFCCSNGEPHSLASGDWEATDVAALCLFCATLMDGQMDGSG